MEPRSLSVTQDRSSQVLGVNVTFWILSWLAVLLRVYVRVFLRKSFGIDDWLILVTQFFFTIFLSCELAGVIYGTGRHIADLPIQDAERALMFWYLCELFYVISTSFLKISVGFFLLRITIRPTHISILRCLTVETALFGILYLIIGLVQCNLISNWWTIPKRGCMSDQVVVSFNYVGTVVNSVADWTYGLLPIFIIRNLHMSCKLKLIVMVILSFAAIGSIGTVVRIPFIYTLYDTEDFLYATVDLAVWSTVEVGVGIVASCAATLRPLLQAIRGSTHTDPHSRYQTPSTLGPSMDYRHARVGYRRNIDNSGGNMQIDVLPLTNVSKVDVLCVTEDCGKFPDEHVDDGHDRTTSWLMVDGTEMSVSSQAKEVESDRLRSSKIKETTDPTT